MPNFKVKSHCGSHFAKPTAIINPNAGKWQQGRYSDMLKAPFQNRNQVVAEKGLKRGPKQGKIVNFSPETEQETDLRRFPVF